MSYTIVPHIECWQNLIVPTESPSVPTIKTPSFAKFIDNGAGSDGVWAWQFPHSKETHLFFVVPLPHSYWEGTDMDFHILWSPTTAAAGSVVWGLEYTWANIGDVIPASTISTTTSATDSTAYKHHITVLTTIPGTGKKIRSTFMGRIYRDGGHASDTYNADTALLEVSLTFKQNTVGSYDPIYKV